MKKVFYADDDSAFLKIVARTLPRKSRTGDQALDVKVHLVEDGKIPPSMASFIPTEYDAVILDNDWGWGHAGKGIDFAAQMRDSGFKKPIIIYSASSEEDIRRNPNFAKSDVILVNKRTVQVGGLNTIVQTALSDYKAKHAGHSAA